MRVILVILTLIGLGLFLTRSIAMLGWFFSLIGFLILFIKVILAASASNHYVFSHMIDMSIPLFTDIGLSDKSVDKLLDNSIDKPVDNH